MDFISTFKLFIILIIFIFIGNIFVYLFDRAFRVKKAENFIFEWEKSNNFSIINLKHRHFAPFKISRRFSTQQLFFEGEISYPSYENKKGYFIVGGFWSGLFSKKVVFVDLKSNELIE